MNRPEHTTHLAEQADPSKRLVLEDVSIVVPTLGRDSLQECLLRIARGSVWPGRLIIVDQGRRPVVADWLNSLEQAGLNTLYIPSLGTGRASGLNEGLHEVKTPFVAITDDDCFVDASWLEVLVEALRTRPDIVTSGKVLAGGDSVILTATSEERTEYRRPRLNFDRLSGGNMATSMAVLRKVGTFDESTYLRTAEDGEWIYRALRAGVGLIYEPGMVVTHMDWREAEARSEQYRSYARSHGGFYGKYLRRGDWFIGVRAAIHFVRAFRTILRGLLTGNNELRIMGRSYLAGLPEGILNGLRNSG
jgi:GT2 family glycosyltransferase